MIVREVVLLCFYSSALSYKQLCSSFLPFFVRDVRDDSQPSNLSEWKLIWSKVQQIILLAVKKIPVGKGWFFGSSCGLLLLALLLRVCISKESGIPLEINLDL